MRRLGAVPVFEEERGVKGIESFIERDYMSSEDDGPGLVSQEVWDAKAKPFGGKGRTVVEIRRLNWRKLQVCLSFFPNIASKKRIYRSAGCIMHWTKLLTIVEKSP